MAKYKKLVQVESICSQQEADVKAPLIAAAYGARWTGSWMPLMADGLGVIEVEFDVCLEKGEAVNDSLIVVTAY